MAGFSDLEYSEYPAVESDERYEFKDPELEDMPYIIQYESLLLAVKTAPTSAAMEEAWEELEAFQNTEDYKQHVMKPIISAQKLQTLEDQILACQRVALKKTQQWVVSESEPTDEVQIVNDIWLEPNGASVKTPASFLMYRKTNSGYIPMIIQNPNFDITEIKVVDALPSDASSHPTTVYLIKE